MKKFIYYLLIITFSFVLCFSAYKLVGYYFEETKGSVYYKEIQPQPVNDSAENNTPPITVDFNELKKQNEDIIAWLYCDNTPINYPVLKSKDNEDYLRHLPNGEYAREGSLFLDCSNNTDFSDFTSIIYGHNMKNDDMFGTLTKYKKQDYYVKHSKMYLLTAEQNYLVELTAGFVTDIDADIYSVSDTQENKSDFIKLLSTKSDFKTEAEFDETDSFIILSTCEYTSESSRYVLVGKLIKTD